MVTMAPGASPIASNPISDADISCPTTPRATASPTPPDTISIPVTAPIDFAFVVFPIPLPKILAPTEVATLPPNASITPIVAPRANDLFLIVANASSSSKTFRTFSSLKSKFFSLNSSCKNSVNDIALSKVAPAAAKAKGRLPVKAAPAPAGPPTAAPPAVAAVIVPAAAAPEAVFIMDAKDSVITKGATVGF